MSRGCPAAPRTADDPSAAASAAWRAHVATCERCAARWIREDPTRVFAALADDPIPAAELDRVSRAVARSIDAEVAAARRHNRASWMTACAAAVLAAGLAVGILGTAPPAPRTASAPDPAVPLAPVVPVARADVRVDADGAAVQVVDLTVGDRQVVMIFDRRMQL